MPSRSILLDSEESKLNALAIIRAMQVDPNHAMVVTVEPYRRRRSLEQNRLLWSIYQEMAEQLMPQGGPYPDTVWHEYCKLKFLGAEEIILPNGKSIIRPNSTAGLSTERFAEYIDQVQAWAVEHGVRFQ